MLPIQATRTAVDPSAVAPGDAPALAADLVPSPVSALADPMAALLALQTHSRSSQVRRARADIDALGCRRTAAWKQLKHALREAEEASKEQGGFWGKLGRCCGTIGRIGTLAASVAAVAASGGAALPLALAVVGATLSAGAIAQGEGHVLQELGMSDSVARGFEIGMTLAGGLATGGSGALLAGGGGVTTATRITTATTAAVSGTGSIASGVQTVRDGESASRAERARADAHEHRLEMSHQQYLIDRLIAVLKEADDQGRRDVQHVRGVIDVRAATSLVAAGGRA